MPPRRKNPKTGEPELTSREKLFVEGVAVGKSLTQAAKDAGYSEKTAALIGAENHRKPIIATAVENARRELLAVDRATIQEAVGRLGLSLRGDLADVFPDEPLLQEARKKGVSKLVKKFKRSATQYGETVEVELYPAHEAAKILAELEGWAKQPDDNPQKTERLDSLRRKAAQKYTELVEDKNWSSERANQLIATVYPEVSPLVQ